MDKTTYPTKAIMFYYPRPGSTFGWIKIKVTTKRVGKGPRFNGTITTRITGVTVSGTLEQTCQQEIMDSVLRSGEIILPACAQHLHT